MRGRTDSGMCGRFGPSNWGTVQIMQVTVERSRSKSVAAVLGCILFVVASFGIFAQGTELSFLVGVAGIVTFTTFGMGLIRLSMRAGPGLVVDDAGFDDRSSLVSVGRVPWRDVRSVSEANVAGSSFVVVEVSDPEVYLARLGHIARMAARVNRHMVGSPITISSVSLKTSFSKLSTVMDQAFNEYHIRQMEL
jgi:hypothetical protein